MNVWGEAADNDTHVISFLCFYFFFFFPCDVGAGQKDTPPPILLTTSDQQQTPNSPWMSVGGASQDEGGASVLQT